MKIYQGTVISTTNDKTLVVEVTRKWVHPKYKKTIKRTKKYLVHDETSKVKAGEAITFTDSRPYSKRKRFIYVAQMKNQGKN